MAMPMSSVFTGPERRKKLVTYGRSAGLSNAQMFHDDAPSPERPHKQVGKLSGASQKPGPAPRAKSAVQASRVDPYDEFDVPSDDEPTPRAAPIKKPLFKTARKPVDESEGPSDRKSAAGVVKKTTQKPALEPADISNIFDVPFSDDEQNGGKQGKPKTTQPLRSKVNATRPKLPLQQTKRLEKKQTGAVSSEVPPPATNTAQRTRAKTPAAVTKPPPTTIPKATKQNNSTSSSNTQAMEPVLQATTKQKPKRTPASSATDTAPTPPTEPNLDFAVFDVPSSDEDIPIQTPVRPRKTPIARAKVPPKISTSRAPLSPEPSAESDTSNASHKRKRGRPASSATTKKAETAQRKREASVPIQRRREASAPIQRKREASIPIQRKREASAAPRSRKTQKTEDNLSPGHRANEASQPSLAAMVQDPPANKPTRTRIRTVPVLSKPMMTKAQSSPVKLHTMLAVRSAIKPSPARKIPEAPAAVEDETMYEIPDETTPRPRNVHSTVSGSVTPRQRTLFSNLLEDDADLATPMPSISKLRINERTPGSAFAALARSASDIPQSAHTRKGRLLDMLKQAAPSASEESDSEEESEADITEVSTVTRTTRPKADRHISSQETGDGMEVDPDTLASSQASRAPLPMGEGTRTYAQQRSYLEETNPEDVLLNWDDDVEVNLPTRQGSVTESEDDSQQVTGLPELRRKGQLYKFEAETQAIIEDISGTANTNISARRSAMMEFATQLAEESYVNQLLESAMTSSLLRAVSTTKDVIFDFAAATAILLILRTNPSYAVVEQIYQSDVLSTLRGLLSTPMCSLDIHRISKDRKTNMSGSARETVAEFRVLILKSLGWPEADVPKLSPQLLAIKVLEELVIGLRVPGNTEAIVDEEMISKMLDVASGPAQRLQSGKATAQDDLTLETTFSALESLSISKDGQATWPDEILSRLADIMSVLFDASRPSPKRLVIRLCMNLANSRPAACETFAGQTFVTRLTNLIVECFRILGDETSRQPATRVRDELILALGAMMNLAEFSDQARLNVVQGDDGEKLPGKLVRIFLEGSERAEQASSVSQSHTLVPIGYLTIMLGNLCLNAHVRRLVTSMLPDQNFDILVLKVREFVEYNQRLDRGAEFEGKQGEGALKNFTRRLMLVVERLEGGGKR